MTLSFKERGNLVGVEKKTEFRNCANSMICRCISLLFLLQSELRHLIVTLASYDGPYLVCAQRLQDCLNHFEEDTTIHLPPEDHCHHDILFRTVRVVLK